MSSLPKAMRDAKVDLPEGVVRIGDGYLLPNGWYVVGHGTCILADKESYEKVNMFRAKGKRSKEEDEEEAEEEAEEEDPAKTTAKRVKKADKLIKVLAEVAGDLTADQKDKIIDMVDPTGELGASEGEVDL